MRYDDINGENKIDKSQFILQYESSPNIWLALLSYSNIEIKSHNLTHYIVEWNITFRSKGTNYDIAKVNLEFSLDNRDNLPKIDINLTKFDDWSNLGFTNHRWIWDISFNPSLNYKWVDIEEKTVTELPTSDLIDLDTTSKTYYTLSNVYDDLQEWLLIDSHNVTLHKGGRDVFWNSRGVVVVYPVNQEDIDPSTINTGYDASATWVEQQRKVFRNPRGTQNYYALIKNASYPLYYWYNSTDGETWTLHLQSGIQADYHDLWFWEDDANSRLIVYDICSSTTGNIVFRSLYINDTDGQLAFSRSDQTVASSVEDGCIYPSITMDSAGYVWVTWTDEFTNKGSQRNMLRASVSNIPYPTTETITWDTTFINGKTVGVYGEDDSAEYTDGLKKGTGAYLRSSVVPLTNGSDVGVVFGFRDVDANNEPLKALTLNYDGNSITEGTVVHIDYHAEFSANHILFSCVSTTISDKDRVFILYSNITNIIQFPKSVILSVWNVSEGVRTIYSPFIQEDDPITSISLSIDKSSNPDLLYMIWTNATDDRVYYDVTDIDNYSLKGVEVFEDGVGSWDYDYLSSSYSSYTWHSHIMFDDYSTGGWSTLVLGVDNDFAGQNITLPYDVDLSKLDVHIKANTGGSPTGIAFGQVYHTSNKTLIANSTNFIDVSILPDTSIEWNSFIFNISEVNLLKDAEYIFGVNYSNGDAGNNVLVSYYNTPSHSGSFFYTNSTGDWVENATETMHFKTFYFNRTDYRMQVIYTNQTSPFNVRFHEFPELKIRPNYPSLNYPTNDSQGHPLSVELNVTYSDPNGDTGTVWFYNNKTGDHIGTDTGVLNNTFATYTWSGLVNGRIYFWHVIANDGELNSTIDAFFNFSTIFSINVTYRYTLDGKFLVDNSTIANNTELEYDYNTQIELTSLPNASYGWYNFTYRNTTQIFTTYTENPEKTINLIYNGSMWCYFFNTTLISGNGEIIVMTQFIPENAILVINLLIIALSLIGLKVGWVGLTGLSIGLMSILPLVNNWGSVYDSAIMLPFSIATIVMSILLFVIGGTLRLRGD